MVPSCDVVVFNRLQKLVVSRLDIEPYWSFRKLVLSSMDRYPPSGMNKATTGDSGDKAEQAGR